MDRIEYAGSPDPGGYEMKGIENVENERNTGSNISMRMCMDGTSGIDGIRAELLNKQHEKGRKFYNIVSHKIDLLMSG